MLRDVNLKPLLFVRDVACVKKHKTNVKGHQSGAPIFLYVTLRV
jgi:hypothetical protein